MHALDLKQVRSILNKSNAKPGFPNGRDMFSATNHKREEQVECGQVSFKTCFCHTFGIFNGSEELRVQTES